MGLLTTFKAARAYRLHQKGQKAEARKLYENTEKYYMEEMGFKPSFTSVELLERLGRGSAEN